MDGSREETLHVRARRIVGELSLDTAGPVAAITLAARCSIRGNHESVRRRVRDAVTFGRENMGMRICANGDGYWLAADASEWAAYLNAVKDGGKFAFVRARRMREAATDRIGGQGKLFESREVGWG